MNILHYLITEAAPAFIGGILGSLAVLLWMRSRN